MYMWIAHIWYSGWKIMPKQLKRKLWWNNSNTVILIDIILFPWSLVFSCLHMVTQLDYGKWTIDDYFSVLPTSHFSTFSPWLIFTLEHLFTGYKFNNFMLMALVACIFYYGMGQLFEAFIVVIYWFICFLELAKCAICQGPYQSWFIWSQNKK